MDRTCRPRENISTKQVLFHMYLPKSAPILPRTSREIFKITSKTIRVNRRETSNTSTSWDHDWAASRNTITCYSLLDDWWRTGEISRRGKKRKKCWFIQSLVLHHFVQILSSSSESYFPQIMAAHFVTKIEHYSGSILQYIVGVKVQTWDFARNVSSVYFCVSVLSGLMIGACQKPSQSVVLFSMYFFLFESYILKIF